MKRYTYRFLLLSLSLMIALATGCSADQSAEIASASDKVQIVTTLFPQYDFVKQIAGDTVEVTLLLPPGVEAHAYEPTPHDIVKIQNSDVFIYTGEEMEPWAHKVIETVGEDHIVVIEAGQGLFDLAAEEHDHEAEDHDHDSEEHDVEAEDHDHEAEEHDQDGEDHDHDHSGADPHIWLDPVKAQAMLQNIEAGLVKVMPENAALYSENSKAYQNEIEMLNTAFKEVFSKTESKTIVSGGHFAFGHFIKRYGLEYKSPYVGFAPDAEPTPKRIAELIDFINESHVRAIFYEELVDPRVATVIADETDAQMLMLHAAHNVSKEELESGISYVEIMKQNLENLKIGLGYKEGE